MSVIVLRVTKSIKVSDIEKYQLVPAEAWSFGQIFLQAKNDAIVQPAN